MKTKKLVKNYCVSVLNREDLTVESIEGYMDSVYVEFEADVEDKDVKAINKIIVKCYFKELKRQIKNMYA